jgi:hypothetical protein
LMTTYRIVLFTSDCGCHFKTRNAEYKRSCHESSIRVPTALREPGFDGGGQIRQLVNIVDLPPTLLDAAGLPVPDDMYGMTAPGKNGKWDSASEHYVEEVLYDPRADSYELANLIGLESHREVAVVMRERLIRRMVEAREAEPAIEPAPSHSSQHR